jgi:hypothetical protein
VAETEEDDRWWATYAKCRGLPPEFFFPVMRDGLGLPILDEYGAQKPDLGGVAAAKDFCNGKRGPTDEPCPVRKECLHWSIVHNEWDGVYGGMVERDRRKYAKRKRSSIAFGGGVKAPTRQRPI